MDLTSLDLRPVEIEACLAARALLVYNSKGPFGLPRVAAWGYPEPYTRDLLIASLGALLLEEDIFLDMVRRMFSVLARNQSPLGLIPTVASDPHDRGASDTTPLYLMALAAYRFVSGETGFHEAEARRSMEWLHYQSPDDRIMLAQYPTTDWMDELQVGGYALFINTILYADLLLWGEPARAAALKRFLNLPYNVHAKEKGLAIEGRPYFAHYAFKERGSERFDLLGNCLAVLFGLVPKERAEAILDHIRDSLETLNARNDLAPGLVPCLFPYVLPGDLDWDDRYFIFCQPGHYHNGGVWPFTWAFYIVALVKAGRLSAARSQLEDLTAAIKLSKHPQLNWGFNEWLDAQSGHPRGEDWQSWSAGMYLFAAIAVAQGRVPIFDLPIFALEPQPLLASS
ncbi:MAG: amylo-alpha-1,6-glucosidase [Chloroflexi bacterium]|nr:amylo-alpha-1,6-glucosidase [Chloroflexota bacterium]